MPRAEEDDSKDCRHLLFLEPFFGGSHRDFAEGLIGASRHRWQLLTLPARFWKWRMRGASLWFLKEKPSADVYDALMVTGLMGVSDLKALWPGPCPPILLYFHESQLTYPLSPGETMDLQYGFTDITSALAADRVLFNSRHHLRAFLDKGADFFRKMPESRPFWVLKAIEEKAEVAYPGCRFPSGAIPLKTLEDAAPLIVWNHRWEFDKGPDVFFRVLDRVASRGIAFRLALLGERFRNVPQAFTEGRSRHRERIVTDAYAASRECYLEWLGRGAVVVSTALHENFGISVVEAVRHGCLPLLPDRLSYPELVPDVLHRFCLYADEEELVEKLCHVLKKSKEIGPLRERLSRHMASFSWEARSLAFDDLLARLGKAPRPYK